MNWGNAVELLESLTNQARVDAGLPLVTPREHLQDIAQQRADEMASGNWFSHDRPDGTDFLTMLRDARVPFRDAAENLGRPNQLTEDDLRDMHARWMASPQHQNNVLGPYNNVGVGVAEAGNGWAYLCIIFTRE